MQTSDWEPLIRGRRWAYAHPPWHLISRWAQQSGEKIPVMALDVAHNLLSRYTFTPFHLREYYFGQHGISVQMNSWRAFSDILTASMHNTPSFRIIYQTSKPYHSAVAAIEAAIERFAYQLCGKAAFPNSTVVLTYRWEGLQCEPPKLKAVFETNIGSFFYFGTHPRPGDDQLLISGEWQPITRHAMNPANLSYQLVDKEWQNMAQLDLPLEVYNGLRRYSIAIDHVPAGDYRLMAIVYNARTGERQVWRGNEDWIPEMQQLAEIEITGTTSEQS